MFKTEICENLVSNISIFGTASGIIATQKIRQDQINSNSIYDI